MTFLLYVNDLASLKISGNFTFFADDATILWHGGRLQELRDSVNEDLVYIKQWCDANKLSLNISKTNFMSFKCELEEIKLDNKNITTLTENKFLGIYIDSKLKFTCHIGNLTRKLASN